MAKAGGAIRVTLQGGAQLLAKLKRLEKKQAGGLIRKGLRAGAKIIAKETKSNAPVGPTGRLAKAAKVRAMRRKRGRLGVLVQIGSGFYQGETFYGAFVVLGRKTGKRNSSNRRQVLANNFMKRAAETKQTEAIAALEDAVRTGLETLR